MHEKSSVLVLTPEIFFAPCNTDLLFLHVIPEQADNDASREFPDGNSRENFVQVIPGKFFLFPRFPRFPNFPRFPSFLIKSTYMLLTCQFQTLINRVINICYKIEKGAHKQFSCMWYRLWLFM